MTSLLTFGLLVATGVYAWLTHRILASTDRQSREISRPRVLVSVSAIDGGQFLVLNIENIGLSSAEQLELALDRPVHQSYGKLTNLQDYPIFNKAVSTFPPKALSRYGFGIGYFADSLDRSLHPLCFSVTANYQYSGFCYKDVFNIDIQAQHSKSLLDPDYIQQFGKNFPKEFGQFGADLIKAIAAKEVK